MTNTASTESFKQLGANVQSLLANERTLLAWIRTGLTIQAGGVALTAFHPKTPIPGVIVLFLGILVALIGYNRYREADKSIRAGELPRSSAAAALQVYAIAILAVVIALAQVTVIH